MSQTSTKPVDAHRVATLDVPRLVRYVPSIIACGALAAAAAYLVASSRPEEYTATATLQVPAPDVLAQLNGAQFLPTDNQIREASTVASLITQPAIAEQTSRALDGQVDAERVAAALDVAVANDANLVTVSATDGDPRLAAQIATATATTFVAERQRRRQQDNESAQREIRSQLEGLTTEERASATGRLMRERLREVQARSATGSDVSLVQPARAPTMASAPLPGRLAIIGLVGGLLLGFALAALRVRLDSQVRTQGEFEAVWPLPLVGPIPRRRGVAPPSRALPEASVLEAFGSARVALRQYGLGDERKAIVVTSAAAGEGKTTTVWHLAVVSALAGSRVLVIEADLRTPTLGAALGVEAPGLSRVLLGTDAATDVLTTIELSDAERSLEATVDVIIAGAPHASPSVLIERPAMNELLDGARTRYDLVLVDAPDAAFGDALVLAGHADGTLVAFRPGRPNRSSIARMRSLLESSGTPVIAGLVNG
jgi:capsular exopolysaccharide synthesis family protein